MIFLGLPLTPADSLNLSFRMTSGTPGQLFGEHCRGARIDGASSHGGRRSFITKLAHSGVSAKVIMELAGHKQLGTTPRYIEVNDKLKRAAAKAL